MKNIIKYITIAVLILPVLLYCSNNSSTKTTPIEQALQSAEFQGYNQAFEELIKVNEECFKNIDQQELAAINDLVVLAQESPEKYQSVLEAKIVNVLGVENIELIESKANLLRENREIFTGRYGTGFVSDPQNQNAIIEELSKTILTPEVAGYPDTKTGVRECVDRCQQVREISIQGAKYECALAIAAGVIGMNPASIGVAVAYAYVSYQNAFHTAVKIYDICLTGC